MSVEGAKGNTTYNIHGVGSETNDGTGPDKGGCASTRGEADGHANSSGAHEPAE